MSVSKKRDGCAPPAICQTMSGGVPWFQMVVSVMMRSFSACEVMSAEMALKRWVAGFLAADWRFSLDEGLKGGSDRLLDIRICT